MTTTTSLVSLNENMMLEMMKTKLIMDSGLSNISTGDGLFNILFKLVIIMMITYLSKNITELLSKCKDILINIIPFTEKEYKIEDFKYRLEIALPKYRNLIYKEILSMKYINKRKHLSLSSSIDVEDSYNLIVNKIVNNLGTKDNKCVYKLRRIKFDWIYYSPEENSLLSNHSMGHIINFLEILEKEYGYDKHLSIWVNYKYIDQSCKGDYIKLHSNLTFNDIFFEQKEEVLRLLENFNDINYYRSKKLPRHLSFLIHGVPGTSKTSFIKALSKYSQKHIYMIDCAKINTKKEFWQIISTCYKEYLLVFEDFDRIPCVVDMMKGNKEEKEEMNYIKNNNLNRLFKAYVDAPEDKKENLYQKYNDALQEEINNDKLDLAYILNILDGVCEFPGRLIVFTANHPEILSPALKRPGRIDCELEFKKANRYIAEQILQSYFKVDDKIDSVPDYKYTHAEIYSCCKKYNCLGKVREVLV